MKRLYSFSVSIIVLAVVAVFAVPTALVVNAENTNGQLRSQVAGQPDEAVQQQLQDQVQTQNEGEESQLLTQVQNQVQEAQEQQQLFQESVTSRSISISQKVSTIIENRLNGETGTSPSAILRRTTRAQELVAKMDTVLDVVGKVDGIQDENLRTQLNIIARDQLDIQSKIEEKWAAVEARPRVVKWILGPDYNSLRDVRNQMTQNELQLNLMTQMRNRTTNEADKQIIQENIQALIQQNTELQEQITAEEGTFSLFGWFAKLFAR